MMWFRKDFAIGEFGAPRPQIANKGKRRAAFAKALNQASALSLLRLACSIDSPRPHDHRLARQEDLTAQPRQKFGHLTG
jgi:hypothetical protein